MSGIGEIVCVEHHGAIAIVFANNPPVNALSHRLREALLQLFTELENRSETEAIVLACKGRTFFVGADITELGRPRVGPSIQKLVRAIDGLAKPTVAAVHGMALGGGLEMALGCHYRVAQKDTVFGLPEITLGLIAGGGGTKLLSRLIGPEATLELCMTGETISAARALELGAIDAISEVDVLAAAIDLAQQICGKKLNPVGGREDKIAATRADPAAFEARAAAWEAKLQGFDAAAGIIGSVRDAFRISLADGLDKDHDDVLAMTGGPQARALRYLFAAERHARKRLAIPALATPQDTRERLAAVLANMPAQPEETVGERLFARCAAQIARLRAGGAPLPNIERAFLNFGFPKSFAARLLEATAPVAANDTPAPTDAVSDATILAQLLPPIVNEGARLLQDGLLDHAIDIDLIWVYALGWPAWKGGPMFYAGEVGLEIIVRQLSELSAAAPEDKLLTPVRRLAELAKAGRNFMA